jgi:hypothetical protein
MTSAGAQGRRGAVTLARIVRTALVLAYAGATLALSDLGAMPFGGGTVTGPALRLAMAGALGVAAWIGLAVARRPGRTLALAAAILASAPLYALLICPKLLEWLWPGQEAVSDLPAFVLDAPALTAAAALAGLIGLEAARKPPSAVTPTEVQPQRF